MQTIIVLILFLAFSAIFASIILKAKSDVRHAKRLLALTIRLGLVDQCLWQCFDRAKSNCTVRYQRLERYKERLMKERDQLLSVM
ncbi:MAG: hypothetical protein A3C06_00085 [Candidatus Taylorbacteria bacterium RIFCSPHIGHO2_02_FULL_46_13]|uniref:Uncharacterized protein n=1 Tax=Candidatus Taylorbacteria bacterium RIFCSPHIGHO2_02_FULL_46_13 TaxID=1802312 RepID=A0A1G2MUS1_9BACT|nr:MAG: hypothetical protein A3C06_00085 [Candidatus Taylorbacteria bacterium RIFCSPHIGHO2_02_FULL_46_13]